MGRIPGAARAAVVTATLALAAGPASAQVAAARPGILIERDVMVPMADGTRLAADVYRPRAPGRYPVLLERTPYGKAASSETAVGAPAFFARRGYAFVVQDTRGRFGSEGVFYPTRDDGWGANKDGFDTVEWLARRPWSTGKVGLVGGSQSGQSAYAVGPTRPEGLTAMFVRESASEPRAQWFYRGGAFQHGFATTWAAVVLGPHVVERTLDGRARAEAAAAIAAYVRDRGRLEARLPLAGLSVLNTTPGFGFYHDWLKHPEDGPFWRGQDVEARHAEFDVPVYHLGGWYDIVLDGTLRNFNGLRARAATREARAGQRLVVGPWVHGPSEVGDVEVGDLRFEGADAVGYNALRLRWFDRWLKGVDNGVTREPPVLIYVMGDNAWRHENEWPLARTRYVRWHLRGGTSGSVDSLNDGTFAPAPPAAADAFDSFVYDPTRPVRTLGGSGLYTINGPRDHREADEVSLTYTSEPLKRDLEVTGPVKAVLYGLSTGVDTDWTVRLSEVYPDGRSINIVDGIRRARYRESDVRPALIEPGRVYRYEVDLWSTSNVFKAGNRLRVAVHSSNFPRFSRNLNTAESPESGRRPAVVTNTVFRDRLRPSHVVLPVIPR